MIHFAEPIFLWLLLLIPLSWYLSRRLRLIAWGRRAAIVTVRTLLLLALVLGLARMEIRWESRDLAVLFLLDRSDSIPAELKTEQGNLLKALSGRAGVRDETGVIAFGEKPSIETPATRTFDYEGQILSEVNGERTDLSAALRLALAAFPSDRMRRIVVMSDGNENLGSAVEVARVARNGGVAVDVIPMNYEARNDVQLEKIVVPQRTSKDAPFDIKIYTSAEKETPALLRVYEDGNVIIEERVTVRPGRNAPLTVSRRLSEGGFHTYTATIEAEGDLRPQNNRGSGFTYLKSEPRVLLVEGGMAESARYLAGALRAENIAVEIGGPGEIPTSFDRMQRYDSIILSNVPADAMSVAQMRLLERAVHDLGIGLIMIGGENSFGAGGYQDTPVELALPVSMDIKQKKMLPNGALVLVLHTCEMPSGNDWAREIALASLNVLSAQDYFGINYLGMGASGRGGWGEEWLWDAPIQLVGDKRAMRTAIKGVTPLDAPSFDSLMKLAADELVPIKAQTKHIVVISDGDPAPPSQAVVQKIRDAGITVSGVAIFPHDPSTVESLRHMATWGAGNFYFPKTGAELPRIFTKEATVVRKSLIREETFTPRFGAPSEMLLGFAAVPDMNGYVITTVKDLATEALSTGFDDPLLVHWRYGLGKTVAFTSDAKDKWATNWVAWGSFSKIWSQMVRWSLREANSPNFQVNTEIVGGTGKVTIDAVDDGGNFLNFIDFDASVIDPEFKSVPLDVRQVAPGRYEANFPATRVGTYMLSMATGEESPTGSPQFLTSGVALSYSPEYETSQTNTEFLKKIAEAAGGKFVEGGVANYNPYLRDLAPSRRPLEMWPWLLLLGVMLLPMDVFFRRVYVNWGEAMGWLGEKFLGMIPRRAPAEYDARMASLRAAKTRATRDKEEEKAERDARAAFRDRLSDTESRGQGESVFGASQDADTAARGQKQAKPTDADPPTPGAPPPGGMASLMEAKKRAQQRRKK